MKLTIKCPVCEWNGVFNNLAEYLPENGIVSIRRSRQLLPGQTTIVVGNDFEILCGNCKNVAFRKTPVIIQQQTTLLFGTA